MPTLRHRSQEKTFPAAPGRHLLRDAQHLVAPTFPPAETKSVVYNSLTKEKQDSSKAHQVRDQSPC